MKKILVVVLVVAIALLGATAAMAGVANSKHDLSSTSSAAIKATSTTLSSCQFCHAPHNALSSNGAPLWNRALATTAGYTPYSFNTSTTTIVGLGGASLICMSCHDGVTSIGDVLHGTSATAFQGTVAPNNGRLLSTAAGNLGTDFSDDHPVGFVVDDTKAGLDAFATMAGKFKFFQTNHMECATCHDVHNYANGAFLRQPKSSICADCHVSM